VQINRNALLQAKSKNMKVRTKVGGKVEITCEIEPPATDYTMVRGESFSSFRGDFILTEDVEILAGATSVRHQMDQLYNLMLYLKVIYKMVK